MTINRCPSGRQDRVNEYFTEESQFWKDIYQQNDVYAAVHQLRRGLVLDWIDKMGPLPGLSALDIGCGAGLATLALAERGFTVTAMDSVQAMLDQTRHVVSKAGLERRVRIILGDSQELSFKDSSFSLVLALGVIPWLHSPERALLEMARVLKPGGYLIVSADNRWRLNHVLDPQRIPLLTPVRRKVRLTLEKWRLLKTCKCRWLNQFHSLHEFNCLLNLTGLEKKKQMTFGFGPFTFLNMQLFPSSAGIKVHKYLQGLAERNFPVIRSVGCQYLVLARKYPRESEQIHIEQGIANAVVF